MYSDTVWWIENTLQGYGHHAGYDDHRHGCHHLLSMKAGSSIKGSLTLTVMISRIYKTDKQVSKRLIVLAGLDIFPKSFYAA